MPQVSRQLKHADGQHLDIFLGEFTTTDATPTVIYTSNIAIPELRILEIRSLGLIRDTGSSTVASILKRGLYTRASGGSLRLVDSATATFVGELIASDVDVMYGTAGNFFTISARGKAATTYKWTFRIEVLRNNS